MDRNYEEAFTEIDEIFKIMPIDLLSKIPAQFRQIISENKAKDYNVKLEEPLDEKKLKKETIIILGLIYRDFLASPEEREELQKRDSEEIKKIEEDMRKQYDVENIFQKRKNKNENEEDEKFSTELTIYKKPNFLKKIWGLIKGIFK